MSNRKLRHDLDTANKKIEKLANELEALRDELRTVANSRPAVIREFIERFPEQRPFMPSFPSTPLPWPGWPNPQITCGPAHCHYTNEASAFSRG